MNKISLHGFNNLTKNLSFSLYRLHYLHNDHCAAHYHAYIAQNYSAEKLDTFLTNICHAIGGKVLNVAKQDYQPQGASVTLMISEGEQAQSLPNKQDDYLPSSLVAHLDKSHLCIHTYPDDAPQHGIAIFRADIELSTCGVISPLKVLNYVIEAFKADIVDIDYRIRGMTRKSNGEMLFVDDRLENISDHLSAQFKASFKIKNHNLTVRNLFHSKLCRNEVELNNHVFSYDLDDLTTSQQSKIKTQIERDLQQLFTHSVTR